MDLQTLERANELRLEIKRIQDVLQNIERFNSSSTYLKFRFGAHEEISIEYDSKYVLTKVNPLLIRSMILEDLKAQLSELQAEFENL